MAQKHCWIPVYEDGTLRQEPMEPTMVVFAHLTRSEAQQNLRFGSHVVKYVPENKELAKAAREVLRIITGRSFYPLVREHERAVFNSLIKALAETK